MSRIKGGQEVLGLVPGPRTEVNLTVSCYLNPPQIMYTAPNEFPIFATSAIPLPKIPISVQGDRLKIWECYKVRTGLLNFGSWHPVDPNTPFNGPSGNRWSVSGNPMSMIPIQPSNNNPPPVPAGGLVPQALLQSGQGINLVDYNPFVENARYFVREGVGLGGAGWGDNNSTVVLLTDEDGWGIMCPNGECFLTQSDYIAQQQPEAAGPPVVPAHFVFFLQARYFTLHFRQRYVRSPVVLADLFESYTRRQIQGYEGETGNIEGVSMQFGWERDDGPGGMISNSGIARGNAGDALAAQRQDEREMNTPVAGIVEVRHGLMGTDPGKQLQLVGRKVINK